VAYQAPITVVPSAARTTTGNSGPLQVFDGGATLALWVNVTATGGTPNMVLTVQWSQDGGATFADPDTGNPFTAITTTKVVGKSFPVLAPVYRIVWTITGTTPSFTFLINSYVTP